MRLKTLAAGVAALTVLVGAPATAQAAWPGVDGLIAITEETDNDITVALIDGNGTKTTFIDTDGAFDGQPSFDPTGNKLAYVRVVTRGADTDIWQIRERSVNNPASDRLVWEAPGTHNSIGALDYSADGTRIFFAYLEQMDEPLNGRVDSIKIDGTDRRTHINDTSGFEEAAALAGLYAFKPGGLEQPDVIVRATADPNAPTSIPLAPENNGRVIDTTPEGQGILYRGSIDAECGQRLLRAPALGGAGTPVGTIECGETLRAAAAAPAGGRAAVIVDSFVNDAVERSVRIANFSNGVLTPLVNVNATTIDWQPFRAPTTLIAEPSIAKVLSPTGTSVNLKLQARLTRGATPVGGQKITFKNGSGGTLCTATTNSNGVATCNGLAPLLGHLLSLGYNAFFAGAPGLAPSSDHAPIIRVLTINLL